MGKGSGRHSGDSSDGCGGLGHEDFLLWKAFTHDIDPLEEPDWGAAEAASLAAPQQKQTGKTIVEKLFAPLSKPKEPAASGHEQPAQLDARTEARLKRGQMPVEARLDLHGCTQAQAHYQLNAFVTEAHTRGKRCVLVITGKGSSRNDRDEYSVGILRQKLPLWISMSPLREIVLKAYPAIQRDGGTGAWYLYLKRQRDY